MIRICSLWSTENVQWQNADWTWGECQLVAEVCAIWGQSGFRWSNASFTWNDPNCGTPTPPEPTSSYVANAPGVDASLLVQPWMIEEPWNPYKNISKDKKKRLVKLICKVKGKQYEEEKEMRDFDVSIDDIRMVVKAVSNIDLKMEK